MVVHFPKRWAFLTTLSFLAAVGVPSAFADSVGAPFSPGRTFAEKTGEALYANLCQACHMGEGQGAVGAGRYPPLARNDSLRANRYPIYVVLHGQKAMPPFGGMLSDDQVAAVVNYVRTHFGNDYKDAATAEDVKQAR
ncbi:MAG: cytochrome c [Proteobacteria bacterium]|nr:cytochrome c [Pseudomonadota bacterium]